MNRCNALTRCIEPISPADFIEKHWEKEPLLIIRDEPDRFSDLLSISAIDNRLAVSDVHFPAIRIVKGGGPLSVDHYTTRRVSAGFDTFVNLIDPEKVYDLYQNGATIVVQALQRNWEPLIGFCRELSSWFSHPVSANAYLTPQNSQGFSAHFDTHSVFVLQIEGRKRWRIYDSPFPRPNKDQRGRGNLENRQCISEFDLEPGSTLFIPRGWFHEALTVDTCSLHVTIAIKQITYYDSLSEIVSYALEKCVQNATLREALPLAFMNSEDHTPEQVFHERFSEALEYLMQFVSAGKAFDLMVSKLIKDEPANGKGRLEILNKLPSVSLESPLQVRSDLIFRITSDDQSTALEFGGKRMLFLPKTRVTLDHMARVNSFVPAHLPDDLQNEEKLALVRLLLKEGFLTSK